MDKKMVGIIATVATVLCCACPGLFMCLFGVLGLVGAPVTTELNGVQSVDQMGTGVALALICGSLFMIIIPIVVGFVTLRPKKEVVATYDNSPLPPAA
jgi:hypothetical protein